MLIHEALEIVLELARQNVIDDHGDVDVDLKEEQARQLEAIELVENLPVIVPCKLSPNE